MELTAMHLTHLKAAAEEANFEQLYSHEVRQRYGGAAEWDLSTCESDDPEAPDCESIARLYHRDNINYFIEVTPERVLAMVEEIRRLRAALDAKPDAAPVEPAPAREIAVGDTVRITSGMYEGLVGKVTIAGKHTVTVVTDGGNYRPFRVDQVEPA